MSAPLAVRAHQALRSVQLLHTLMLAYLTVFLLVWPGLGRAPFTGIGTIVWAVAILPWLAVMRGVWRGGLYAHAALAFINLVYFAQAVIYLFTPGRVLAGVVGVTLTTALFVTSTLYIRWQARAQRLAATEAEAQAHGDHD